MYVVYFNRLTEFSRLRFQSDSSGSKLAPGPPTCFLSQYLLTQASQLFPAAGSRPLNASAAISEYAIFTRPLPFFGKILTNEALSVVPPTRSKIYPSILLPSFCVRVTSPR